MFHEKVVVPFRNTTLVMSTSEANDLIEKLTSKFVEQREGTALHTPAVTDDGYLTYEAIYTFFSQLYEKPTTLRNRAGRLHGRLISAIGYKTLSVEIKCTACGTNDIDAQCLSGGYGGHRFSPERRSVAFEVQSLKRISSKAFQSGTTKTGPGTLEDFESLKAHL